jgi:hypothetical protein
VKKQGVERSREDEILAEAAKKAIELAAGGGSYKVFLDSDTYKALVEETLAKLRERGEEPRVAKGRGVSRPLRGRERNRRFGAN